MNHWPHGYAYTYNGLFEPTQWVFTNSKQHPCVIARQPYGLIAITNSDAGVGLHTDNALREAHRAVGDMLNRRANVETFALTEHNHVVANLSPKIGILCVSLAELCSLAVCKRHNLVHGRSLAKHLAAALLLVVLLAPSTSAPQEMMKLKVGT